MENLSADLQKEFPGMHGWSVANLWRMRKFYLTYCKDEKVAPLVREISWSLNVLIFERLKKHCSPSFLYIDEQTLWMDKNLVRPSYRQDAT